MKGYRIDVFNIVGGALCIEADDGQSIYEYIQKTLKNGTNIIISFKNIEMVTTAFLNTAIGQLYREYNKEEISSRISFEDISDDIKVKIKRVNQTAKLFYEDPDRLQRTINEVLGEQNEQTV